MRAALTSFQMKALAVDPFSVHIQVYPEGIPVKLSSAVKPISYLKAHAAEMIRDIADRGEPVIITQNGEAKAVLQDMRSFEELQESLLLLKSLLQGEKSVSEGHGLPAREAFAEVRRRVKR